MLFPGEKEAVAMVLRAGEAYGYGNLIAHLRRAWAINLMTKYGLSKDAAIDATNSSPYPLDVEDRRKTKKSKKGSGA